MNEREYMLEINDLNREIREVKADLARAVTQRDLALSSYDPLRLENDKLRRELRHLRPFAECYRRLQEAVLGNESLMDEWQRFCVMLKLSDPEIHKYTRRE